MFLEKTLMNITSLLSGRYAKETMYFSKAHTPQTAVSMWNEAAILFAVQKQYSEVISNSPFLMVNVDTLDGMSDPQNCCLRIMVQCWSKEAETFFGDFCIYCKVQSKSLSVLCLFKLQKATHQAHVAAFQAHTPGYKSSAVWPAKL